MSTAAPSIGPYPLLAKLGEGGMGAVYLALHRGVGGFEKKVAIKCILPHVAEDRQFIDMLVDEAKLTAQLTHPNIAQVIDLAVDRGMHFLVMEYVEGANLHVLRRHCELSIDEAVYVAAEAARGLAYAHRKRGPDGNALGIVHRDISAHNILVSCDGLAKVLDFGIAKAASKRQATQVGVLKGKIPYMSPEQAAGKLLDGRSDLFSLGIVLWEMCTAKRLFEGDTEIQLLMRVQRCEVEPPSRVVPGFPRALEDILMRCLAADRESRYADGDAFADELHGFLRTYAGAEPPRMKLAERVRRCLADNPPAPLSAESPTPVPVLGKERTIVSDAVRPTRVVLPVVAAPTKKQRRVLAVFLFMAVTMTASAGAFFFGRKAIDTVPLKAQALLPPAADAVISGEESSSIAPVETPAVADPLPAAPVQAPMSKPEQTQRVERPKSRSVGDAPRREVHRATVPATAATTGFVSLNAAPWARVYLDGKKVAESTPMIRHELPAGTYRFVLVNPEVRVRREVEVRVRAGEHVRTRVDMQ